MSEEPSATQAGEFFAPLPDAVRARVVALASAALGDLPAEQLPASLRRVAGFAPARRARLAGTRIAAVLETDEAFRGRIVSRLRVELPETVRALEHGTLPPAADPVDVAAVAYLLRPEGWLQVVATVGGALAGERESSASREAAAREGRLREEVARLQQEVRGLRTRHRDEVARLKQENQVLRHRLADARLRAETARSERDRAVDAAESARRDAVGAESTGELEVRRLRGRTEELEAEIAGLRRTERAGRGQETLRARLLLDTLLETAQGLRRELALPTVAGAPADAVAAHVAEQGSRVPSGHGSMAVDDPAMLEQLLALPRVHLVVDGYNLTKSTWPELSLERQRDRLLGGLAPLAARTGAEVTVVFDAAETTERPLVNRPRQVRVLFSPYGVLADDVIGELVAAEPPGRPVVVVTGDRAVIEDVRRSGARCVAPGALSRML